MHAKSSQQKPRAVKSQIVAGIAGISLVGLVAGVGLAAAGPTGSLGSAGGPSTTSPTTPPSPPTTTTAPTTTTPVPPGEYVPPVTSLPDFDGVLGSDGTKFRVVTCDSPSDDSGRSDATVQVRGTSPFEGVSSIHWYVEGGLSPQNLGDYRLVEGTFSMYLADVVPAPKRFNPVFSYEDGADISISYTFARNGEQGETHNVEIKASDVVNSCPMELPVEPQAPADAIQTEGAYSFAVQCHPGRNVLVARAWTTNPDYQLFSGTIRAGEEREKRYTSADFWDGYVQIPGAEMVGEFSLKSFPVQIQVQRMDVNANAVGPVVTKVFDEC